MGDPIELTALTQAYREQTERNQYCRIGSVKTNIGHLDAAAGIAGLIKCALALRHRAIPATLHYQEPNPQFDFSASPFLVNTELTAWKTEALPRRAGVSSFGIGGTNAHVIMEEFVREESVAAKASEVCESVSATLPLSARSRTALATQRLQLRTYLEQNRDVALCDVAFTLQEGRKEFSHRSAIVAKSNDDAIRQLQGDGDFDAENRQSLSQPGELNDEPSADMTAAGRWMGGQSVDWSAARRSDYRPRRIRLPTYPFERERFWVSPTEADLSAAAAGESDALLPIEDWFSYASWKRTLSPALSFKAGGRRRWLLLLEEVAEFQALAELIESAGDEAYIVRHGERFAQTGFREFSVNSLVDESCRALFAALDQRDASPTHICWSTSLATRRQSGFAASAASRASSEPTAILRTMPQIQTGGEWPDSYSNRYASARRRAGLVQRT
ncbi:MAG: ketoacyl-synthetase C-terminal extension domain-containing protein, partial [Planctomycetota bacterium]